MTSLRCWASESHHPLAAAALGEILGEVLDRVGVGPDLVVLVAEGAHGRLVGNALEALNATLQPLCQPLATTRGEDDLEPSLTLFAAHAGASAPVPNLDEVAGVTLLFGPAPLDPSVGDHPRLPQHQVFGGLVAGTSSGSRWEAHLPEAVGTLCPQWRPVGDPMVITSVEENAITALAGIDAVDRLESLIAELDVADRLAARQGLLLGRLVDERLIDWGAADVATTEILGIRRDHRALVTADPLPLGAVVQFQVSDPISLDEHLVDAGRRLAPNGAAGALVVTDAPLPTIPRPADIAASVTIPVDALLAPIGGATFLQRNAAGLIVIGAGKHRGGPETLG